jgi:eight-cysteine-cluster-containing protein
MIALFFACTCVGPVEEPPPQPLILHPLEEYVPENPAELYADCRERVEGTETPVECASDADCTTAGCNGEVCVTSALAEETFTTCETRLCYSALDACGCSDEGFCRWSLKAPATPATP